MEKPKDDLVEIERLKVIRIGNSLYSRVPACFKQERQAEALDEMRFYRSPGKDETVVRLIKKQEALEENEARI